MRQSSNIMACLAGTARFYMVFVIITGIFAYSYIQGAVPPCKAGKNIMPVMVLYTRKKWQALLAWHGQILETNACNNN
ncbi:MAG: hypothetical protein OSJ45_11750 [Lachnospiraceae bacterium]|nr:hypothetical protein [Lachnospiraceae bacterium]